MLIYLPAEDVLIDLSSQAEFFVCAAHSAADDDGYGDAMREHGISVIVFGADQLRADDERLDGVDDKTEHPYAVVVRVSDWTRVIAVKATRDDAIRHLRGIARRAGAIRCGAVATTDIDGQ